MDVIIAMNIKRFLCLLELLLLLLLTITSDILITK
jgi:hypothetical protein